MSIVKIDKNVKSNAWGLGTLAKRKRTDAIKASVFFYMLIFSEIL